ncbi:MAG: hypothetical protein ACXV74_00230 [Methylobacter sp.]
MTKPPVLMLDGVQICREFGRDIAQDLMGLRQPKTIDMADLA